MASRAKTGGRRKGTPNRATAEKVAEIAATGETPLDYMLRIMRDEMQEPSVRLDAAKSAAQYVHPKLAAIAHSGQMNHKHAVEYSDAELADIAAGGSAGAVAAANGATEPAGLC